MAQFEPSPEWKAVLKKIRGPLPDPLSFYCPVCREPRVLDYRPKLRVARFLGILFLTGILTGIFWTVLAERGFLFFVPVFLFSEGAEWFRIRESFRCPNCRFDPRGPLDPEDRAKLFKRRKTR